MIHEELTSKIIGAFYTVYNTLGYGFLEKVYENALVIELRKLGMLAEQQRKIDVFYDGQRVGEYYADILVDECVVLELKAADALAPEHEAQKSVCCSISAQSHNLPEGFSQTIGKT